MDSIGHRLRLLRETWGGSARKLSLELGLSPGAWHGYESGESLPGAGVLTTLTCRGVDLHWLLTGEGDMLRAVAVDVPGVLNRMDQHQNSELGLGMLWLLAKQSNILLRARLLDVMASTYPTTFTLTELCERLSATVEELTLELLHLSRDGLVLALDASPQRYSASGVAAAIPTTSPSDQSQVALEAIKFILTDVVPKSCEQRAVMLDAVAHVESGKDLLSSLLRFLKDSGSQRHDEKGDVVRIVLAAAVTEQQHRR